MCRRRCRSTRGFSLLGEAPPPPAGPMGEWNGTVRGYTGSPSGQPDDQRRLRAAGASFGIHRAHPTLTLIFRGFKLSVLGRVRVSTPLLMLASMRDWSIDRPSENWR